MAKIVLYGGTFDPFHKAHKAIVNWLSDKFDSVIVIPTNVSYYKRNEKMFTFTERAALVDKEIKGIPNALVSTIESTVDDTWRFVDTVKTFFSNKSTEDEYYIAIGSDSLKDFKTWEAWEEILKMAKLIVFNRPGYNTNLPTDIPYTYIEDINIDISSTQIRKQLHISSFFNEEN